MYSFIYVYRDIGIKICLGDDGLSQCHYICIILKHTPHYTTHSMAWYDTTPQKVRHNTTPHTIRHQTTHNTTQYDAPHHSQYDTTPHHTKYDTTWHHSQYDTTPHTVRHHITHSRSTNDRGRLLGEFLTEHNLFSTITSDICGGPYIHVYQVMLTSTHPS